MVQSRSRTRPATYADLLKVPDYLVAEILDEELYTSPRPTPRHAFASTSLTTIVTAPFGHGRGGPGGWIILAEPELHLGPDILVPDLAGWRRARLARLPDVAYVDVAPDWACEVVSPSTATIDRGKKLRIYARESVGHLWMLDPIARTLEVLRLEQERWTILATHTGAETVRAEPFDVLEIDLVLLWDEGSSA